MHCLYLTDAKPFVQGRPAIIYIYIDIIYICISNAKSARRFLPGRESEPGAPPLPRRRSLPSAIHWPSHASCVPIGSWRQKGRGDVLLARSITDGGVSFSLAHADGRAPPPPLSPLVHRGPARLFRPRSVSSLGGGGFASGAPSEGREKMAAAVLFLVTGLVAAAAAAAPGGGGPRTLVLLENMNLKDTHSLFLRGLAGPAAEGLPGASRLPSPEGSRPPSTLFFFPCRARF